MNIAPEVITDNIIVERVEEHDYENWLPLWKNYQVFYNVNIPEKVTKTAWQRFANPLEPMFCAVAKENGKIIGLVHYLFHRSTWDESDYCYLEDLYVSENMRGKQVGKKLIEYVKNHAGKRFCDRVYWHTHVSNLRGQRLYDWVAQKSGMIEYRMQTR